MDKPKALHKRACALLGVDPEKVRLVGPTEWKSLTGSGVSRNLGISSVRHNAIYVRRTEGYVTYIHEVLHLLFPSRPHWWIFGAAFRLARIPHGQWAYGRWQSGESITESRTKLIELSRKAAQRRNLS